MAEGFINEPDNQIKVDNTYVEQDVVDRTRALKDPPIRVDVNLDVTEVAQVVNFVAKSADLIRGYNQALPLMPPELVDIVIAQALDVSKRLSADVLRGVDAATRDQE